MAGKVNNATPSTYAEFPGQTWFNGHGSISCSIDLSPETAHLICVAPLPQPSPDGAEAVIEFVVSMMTAMLYGVSDPPLMAAYEIAVRCIVGILISPPNHKFTDAVCVALSTLQVVRPLPQEPDVGLWHPTFRELVTVLEQANVIEIEAPESRVFAFNPDGVLEVSELYL